VGNGRCNPACYMARLLAISKDISEVTTCVIGGQQSCCVSLCRLRRSPSLCLCTPNPTPHIT
jgi:hypothetical protein